MKKKGGNKMKINELMVGNKIYRPCCVDRVVEIRENGITGSDGLRGLIAFKELAPIPITEDFLKANGFIHKCQIEPDEYYPEGLFEWEKEVQGNWVTLSVGSNKIGCDWRLHVDNCDRGSIGHVAIQYVHQLQNFMNILGIAMEIIV